MMKGTLPPVVSVQLSVTEMPWSSILRSRGAPSLVSAMPPVGSGVLGDALRVGSDALSWLRAASTPIVAVSPSVMPTAPAATSGLTYERRVGPAGAVGCGQPVGCDVPCGAPPPAAYWPYGGAEVG